MTNGLWKPTTVNIDSDYPTPTTTIDLPEEGIDISRELGTDEPKWPATSGISYRKTVHLDTTQPITGILQWATGKTK